MINALSWTFSPGRPAITFVINPSSQSLWLSGRFSDEANLDDGAMWPAYFALIDLTAEQVAQPSRSVGLRT